MEVISTNGTAAHMCISMLYHVQTKNVAMGTQLAQKIGTSRTILAYFSYKKYAAGF